MDKRKQLGRNNSLWVGCLNWWSVESIGTEENGRPWSLQVTQTSVTSVWCCWGNMEIAWWEGGHFPTVSEIVWSSIQRSQHPQSKVSGTDIIEWNSQYSQVISQRVHLKQQVQMFTFSVLSKVMCHPSSRSCSYHFNLMLNLFWGGSFF